MTPEMTALYNQLAALISTPVEDGTMTLQEVHITVCMLRDRIQLLSLGVE